VSADSDDASRAWSARFDLAANAPTVLLQIRMRAGSMVGHTTEVVRPGQVFGGIAFEAMAARGSGWLIVRDSQLVIQDIADNEGRS
jgi:hypothetical protein